MGYHDIDIDHSTERDSREQKNILFAEDSKFIRTTIVGLLKQAGYTQVYVHDNGEEALNKIHSLQQMARENKCRITEYLNLVISDIEMPKMDGLTLCRQIKHEMGLTDIPVIIFSSLVNQQMIQKCKEVGADAYTTKPQINELLKLMDDNLGLS